MKTIIKLLFFAIIFLIAFSTNPTKEEYISWLSDKYLSQSNQTNQLVNFGMEVLGKPILRASTAEKNYAIFSIYDTELPNGKGGKVLGVFHFFIPISKNE